MKPHAGALRYFCCIKNGTTPASGEADYWDGDVLWATPEDLGKLTSDRIFHTKRQVTKKAVAECNLSVLPAGSVMISTRAPIGHMAINEIPMAFNQGCRGIIPGGQVDGPFLYYLLKSRAPALNAMANGTTFVELSRDELAAVPVEFPPLDTQRRIAQFLDEKTAWIDGLIEKKRALLDRLAEKRQALITRAVTKGLNPDSPLKPSGIDWLGDIPAHWEVKRLKYISPRVSVGIVITPAAYYADEGVLAIRGLNLRAMEFDFTDSRNISKEGHELHLKSELYEGDLVVVRTGDPGTTSVITADLEGTNCVDLVIIRRSSSASSRFLGWFLNSDTAKVQYAMGSEGALQLHFNVETSKEVAVAVPPIEEQEAIAEYIDRGHEYENERAAKVERSVELLEEFRATLITSAVTGQLAELQ